MSTAGSGHDRSWAPRISRHDRPSRPGRNCGLCHPGARADPAWRNHPARARSPVDGSGDVSNWTDASPAFRAAAQGSLSQRPAFLTNGINFNPSLAFNGFDEFLTIPNSQLSGIPNGNAARTLIVVGTNDSTSFRHAVAWGSCNNGQLNAIGTEATNQLVFDGYGNRRARTRSR